MLDFENNYHQFLIDPGLFIKVATLGSAFSNSTDNS